MLPAGYRIIDNLFEVHIAETCADKATAGRWTWLKTRLAVSTITLTFDLNDMDRLLFTTPIPVLQQSAAVRVPVSHPPTVVEEPAAQVAEPLQVAALPAAEPLQVAELPAAEPLQVAELPAGEPLQVTELPAAEP